MRGYEFDLTVDVGCFKASVKGTVQVLSGPMMPGRLTPFLVSEDGTMLVYEIALPAPKEEDHVVAREFTVGVNNAQVSQVSLEGSVLKVDEVKAMPKDMVSLTLVDVDGAGNRSVARTLTFEATDTLPPAQPGEMSVTLKSEE